jgi:hypothetical protein
MCPWYCVPVVLCACDKIDKKTYSGTAMNTERIDRMRRAMNELQILANNRFTGLLLSDAEGLP